MGEAPKCRVLVIMGSGETSPTMVTVHKALAARLGPGSHSAVLLDTPYAFQENAADISARSQAYFARSVGLQVAVVTDADLRLQESPAAAAGLAAIRTSDWVFIGPGSPSYALNRWRGGPVAGALRDRIAAGVGVTVIASAAAAAMGVVAVPVYEIYKVGAEPHWLDGLDLLSALGLKVAVIPHYDNAEGGTHDTRFCYLGERRLSMLEGELPADAAVLGVDEHTALVFDLVAQDAEVVGRGGATVRRAGISTVLPSGSRITLPDLRTLASTGTLCPGISGPGPAGEPRPESEREAEQPPAGAVSEDLPDVTAEVQRRFEAAISAREATAMVTAILDLEAAIEAWATDTDQNDNSDRARAVLRGLIGRLGRAADQGLADPADRLRPAIGPLVTLRETLRRDGAYAAADEIRNALTAAEIDLRDSPDGTRWTVRATGPAADSPTAHDATADDPADDDPAADDPAADDPAADNAAADDDAAGSRAADSPANDDAAAARRGR